jgi:hypothetical protein
MGDAVGVEPFERVAAGAAFLVNIHGKHGANMTAALDPRKAARLRLKSRLLGNIAFERPDQEVRGKLKSICGRVGIWQGGYTSAT